MSRKNTSAAAVADEPKQALEARYRAAGIAEANAADPGAIDSELVAAAGRFPQEALNDVSRMRQRNDDVLQLAAADALERQASELDRPLTDPRTQPLTDFANTTEVVSIWENFRAEGDPLLVSERKAKRHEMRMEARQIRLAAETHLRATAAPELGLELAEVTKSIQRLQHFAAMRQQDLAAVNQKLAHLRDRIGKAIDAGDEELVRNLKGDMADATAQRQAAESAVAKCSENAAKIAGYHQRIAELRALQLAPDNMAWSTGGVAL